MPRTRQLFLEALEDRCVPSNEPVLIVPGFQGSLPPGSFTNFNHNLGLPPSQIAVTSYYNTAINAFTSAGYTVGTDLFPVAYDWREPMAPPDGVIDGTLNGLTATSITGTNFSYAIDYLGYSLKQAAQVWIAAHPGNPLLTVNVVTHSEGGLLARAYLQSSAYGGNFVDDSGQTIPLPRIDQFIQVASPNLGISSAWEAWNGNFLDYVAFGGFSKPLLQSLATNPYNYVLGGGTINGAAAPINLLSITNPTTGQPDPVIFMKQYWPIIAQLSGDYNFLVINGHLTNANSLLGVYPLLADLNGAADPNYWGALAGRTSLVYGTAYSTLTYSLPRVGPPGQIYTITGGLQTVQPGQAWDQTITVPNNGDSVVSLQTALQPYKNDPRFVKFPQTGSTINHFSIMSDPGVLSLVVSLAGGGTGHAALVFGRTPGLGADFLAAMTSSARASPGQVVDRVFQEAERSNQNSFNQIPTGDVQERATVPALPTAPIAGAPDSHDDLAAALGISSSWQMFFEALNGNSFSSE